MFDPFETLGLEKNFSIDMTVLDKLYFEAQKKTHPDGFIQENEVVRKDAIQKAGEINQAYRLLKDPLQRAGFLLKHAGIDLLPHDEAFLGQVMEWNERIQEGEDIQQELGLESEALMKDLTDAFHSKDYKNATVALYRLTYVHNLLSEIGKSR